MQLQATPVQLALNLIAGSLAPKSRSRGLGGAAFAHPEGLGRIHGDQCLNAPQIARGRSRTGLDAASDARVYPAPIWCQVGRHLMPRQRPIGVKERWSKAEAKPAPRSHRVGAKAAGHERRFATTGITPDYRNML